MLSSRQKILIAGVGLSLALFAAGCKKKAPVAPPPPPPAPAPAAPAAPVKPPAPSITQFSAEPTTIQRGQSSTLRWEVSGDISSVAIDQSVGAVQNTGNRRVFPQDSTTYTLTAMGGGGASTATVTVTVSTPPPPPPPPAPAAAPKNVGDRIGELQDAFFDYDSTSLRSDAQSTLTQDAAALKSILSDFPSAAITIEGHCDERGSAEYNLGLGDRRASSARDFLVQLGVAADKIHTVSYGKERPQCTESTEECWQKNRRVHFAPAQ